MFCLHPKTATMNLIVSSCLLVLKPFKNNKTRKQLQQKLYSSESLLLVRDVALEFMYLFYFNTVTQTHCVTAQRLKYRRQTSGPTDPNPARRYNSSFCKHSRWIQGSTLRRPQCLLITDKHVYNKHKPVNCDNSQSWLRWLAGQQKADTFDWKVVRKPKASVSSQENTKKCESITAVSLKTLQWFNVYMYIFLSSSFLTLCCDDSFPSVVKMSSQSNIQTITFYNKLVVVYRFFSSLLKWLLTFFSCIYPEKNSVYSFWCPIGVTFCGFKTWRHCNWYLLFQTVFYCIVFYFSVLQSVWISALCSLFWMMHDPTWSWPDGLSLTIYPLRDNSVIVWPEMNMCMFSVICSGILSYVCVLVFVFCMCIVKKEHFINNIYIDLSVLFFKV